MSSVSNSATGLPSEYQYFSESLGDVQKAEVDLAALLTESSGRIAPARKKDVADRSWDAGVRALHSINRQTLELLKSSLSPSLKKQQYDTFTHQLKSIKTLLLNSKKLYRQLKLKTDELECDKAIKDVKNIADLIEFDDKHCENSAVIEQLNLFDSDFAESNLEDSKPKYIGPEHASARKSDPQVMLTAFADVIDKEDPAQCCSVMKHVTELMIFGQDKAVIDDLWDLGCKLEKKGIAHLKAEALRRKQYSADQEKKFKSGINFLILSLRCLLSARNMYAEETDVRDADVDILKSLENFQHKSTQFDSGVKRTGGDKPMLQTQLEETIAAKGAVKMNKTACKRPAHKVAEEHQTIQKKQKLPNDTDDTDDIETSAEFKRLDTKYSHAIHQFEVHSSCSKLILLREIERQHKLKSSQASVTVKLEPDLLFEYQHNLLRITSEYETCPEKIIPKFETVLSELKRLKSSESVELTRKFAMGEIDSAKKKATILVKLLIARNEINLILQNYDEMEMEEEALPSQSSLKGRRTKLEKQIDILKPEIGRQLAIAELCLESCNEVVDSKQVNQEFITIERMRKNFSFAMMNVVIEPTDYEFDDIVDLPACYAKFSKAEVRTLPAEIVALDDNETGDDEEVKANSMAVLNEIERTQLSEFSDFLQCERQRLTHTLTTKGFVERQVLMPSADKLAVLPASVSTDRHASIDSNKSSRASLRKAFFEYPNEKEDFEQILNSRDYKKKVVKHKALQQKYQQ